MKEGRIKQSDSAFDTRKFYPWPFSFYRLTSTSPRVILPLVSAESAPIVVAGRASHDHLAIVGNGLLWTLPNVLPGLRLGGGLRKALSTNGSEEVVGGCREG